MQTVNLKDVGAVSKRITVIDAMRGIALIGICLTHAMQYFGGLFLFARRGSVGYRGLQIPEQSGTEGRASARTTAPTTRTIVRSIVFG